MGRDSRAPSFPAAPKTKPLGKGSPLVLSFPGGCTPRHAGGECKKATDPTEEPGRGGTTKKPADGSTHWSSRKLAAELGGTISHMTVARIWAKHGLKPHRLEGYMASNDPDFETKAADVIGLYLNPPQHAAVFCVDEKTAIQAWTAKTRCCRCRRGVRSATASSTTGTARCRCTRPSTPRPARCSARPLRATPRPSSSPSSPTSWPTSPRARRST